MRDIRLYAVSATSKKLAILYIQEINMKKLLEKIKEEISDFKRRRSLFRNLNLDYDKISFINRVHIYLNYPTFWYIYELERALKVDVGVFYNNGEMPNIME
jgi:hypothetical protein